jgi:hypothetical protein
MTRCEVVGIYRTLVDPIMVTPRQHSDFCDAFTCALNKSPIFMAKKVTVVHVLPVVRKFPLLNSVKALMLVLPVVQL